MLAGFIGEATAFILILWKVPESPKFLIMQKKFAAAREIINKISHTSIGEDFEFNEQELEVFSEG